MADPKLERNEFEALVTLEQMPNCPLCQKPMYVGPKQKTPMVFVAHGRAALAHDSCRPKQRGDIDERPF